MWAEAGCQSKPQRAKHGFVAHYAALGLAPRHNWRHGGAAMTDPAPVKLSEMPGLPVTGVLYNPRSHRNRDANIVEPDYPVIRVEQPRRR
jgi:hypothetical protein